MRQLLHSLYVVEQDVELCLRGEAVEARRGQETVAHIPLHNLESIVTFAFKPASPALLEACAKRGISFLAVNKSGSVRYKVIGKTHGNPELRLLQYKLFEDETEKMKLAREMITAKIKNGCAVIQRQSRNHPELKDMLLPIAASMNKRAVDAQAAADEVRLRALEAEAAKLYFTAFSVMARPKDAGMRFVSRSRRPPQDPADALLSFGYVLLANMCFSALESVGLDPFFGVLHSTRSGHAALAYDLMEELRPVIVDRTVLRVLNLNILTSDDFYMTDNEFKLKDEGIRRYFEEWEIILHTETASDNEKGKLMLGLLPYWQAQKLSRTVYGSEVFYRPYRAEG